MLLSERFLFLRESYTPLFGAGYMTLEIRVKAALWKNENECGVCCICLEIDVCYISDIANEKGRVLYEYFSKIC